MASIYSRADRPLRDLVRRRHRLVRHRTAILNAQRGVLLQYGFLDAQRCTLPQLRASGPSPWNQEPLLQYQVDQILEQVDGLTQQLRDLDAVLLAQVEHRSDFQRLRTLPGCGAIIALTVLTEVGEITRFSTDRRFCSYCRLVPQVDQSGQTVRLRRGTDDGHRLLTWAFHQAARNAVRWDPTVRAYFEAQLSSRRGHYGQQVVYRAIARKLAQAAYHLLRDGTAYQADRLFPPDERLVQDVPLAAVDATIDTDALSLDRVDCVDSAIPPRGDDETLTDARPWPDDADIPPLDDEGMVEDRPLRTMELDGVLSCSREWDGTDVVPAPLSGENPPPDLPGVDDINWDEFLPVFEDEPVEQVRWFRHDGVPVLEVMMEGVFYKAVPIGIEEALDRELIIYIHAGIVFQQVPIIDTAGYRASEIPLEELDGPFTWEEVMTKA